MRPERLYLVDICDAADSIRRFLSGCDREQFMGDDLLRSAVLHKLTIIGESAAHLSDLFRERHPDVPWTDVVSFRNIAIHEYFAVDWSIVWLTATEDAPDLQEAVIAILESEFQDSAELS